MKNSSSRRKNIRKSIMLVAIISVFILPVLLTTNNCNVSFAAKAKAEAKPPKVAAEAFVVMSTSTSEIVYEDHPERKLQPGAITKYVAAMVAIDNLYNNDELDNVVDIDENLAGYGDTFKLGESVTVGDLLKVMLVGGSSQAAEALAEYSATDRDTFVNEMNAKIMELGIIDTNFKNPSGEYSTGQYTTARDAAVIMQYAMRYDLIKHISLKSDAKVIVTSGKEKRAVNVSTANPLLSNSDNRKPYEKILGGISSYLGSSYKFSQYAGTAVDDDMKLAVIMLDADGEKLYRDAKSLFEYGFSKVSRHTIVKAGKRKGTAHIKGGTWTRVRAYTEGKGFAYIPPEGSTDLIQTKTVMNDNLEVPIKKGDKVGEFRIYVADELKGTVDLVTKKDIGKGWFLSRYYISNLDTILICIALVAILSLYLRIKYVKKQRRIKKAKLREKKLREAAIRQIKIDESRKKRNWTMSRYYQLDDYKEEIHKKKRKK